MNFYCLEKKEILCFFSFLGRQEVCPRSYVSLGAIRKSDLLFLWVENNLCVELILFLFFILKDFGFVVNFEKSSKLETQHDIHKIYSHFIETLSNKSETQHGVHEM